MHILSRVLLIVLSVVLFSSSAYAAKKQRNSDKSYDFTNSARYAGLVVNADTGEIIYQRNANKVLYPASLTKMMTIYVLLKEIEEGNLSFNHKLLVSAKAASMPRTNMRLKAGTSITVKEAMLGLIVHSANDAAVVLAEAISGSEDAFADKMTNIARMLGMSKTVFKNSHGLPNSEQVTCASDMAKLAIALRRDFPNHYHMFSTKSFKFNGHIINSHNRVMNRYKWADGGKTGYINASGYNLVTSASRFDTRLVGVVMGGHTAYARDTHMIQLLEYGYETIINKSLNNEHDIQVASSRVDIPYKEGAFEVAFNDEENSNDEIEIESGGEALGNLVDKGLTSRSKPAKLDIKPLGSNKKERNKLKNKVTVVEKQRADKLKLAKSKKYNKIVVMKKNPGKGVVKKNKPGKNSESVRKINKGKAFA